MSNEEVTRKVRKGSRAYRLNRLTEMRQAAAASPVIASIIESHQDQPIIITEWS